MHLVHGEKYCMVYRKGQSLGHCFLTFLCDLFYFFEGTYIENSADHTTPYSAAKTQECVRENFEIYRCLCLNRSVTIIESE